jgi:hypothetical protein
MVEILLFGSLWDEFRDGSERERRSRRRRRAGGLVTWRTPATAIGYRFFVPVG